ncbi:hypothetical protein CC80DRAFT_533424 [Byssothecium circinans]|uniref:Mid2 domain-containing protein n=1 Tax=Byssothecium circinans TaxID=147558 RepID=A0A6A5U247_9PLEO|nr:hypothetical protein CC80DRAFT_533424 [Byssothecium circinans]
MRAIMNLDAPLPRTSQPRQGEPPIQNQGPTGLFPDPERTSNMDGPRPSKTLPAPHSTYRLTPTPLLACTPTTTLSILDLATWTHTYTYTQCISAGSVITTSWLPRTCVDRTESYMREPTGTEPTIRSSFIFCSTSFASPTSTTSSTLSSTSRTSSSGSISSSSTHSMVTATQIPIPSLDPKPPRNNLVIALPITFLFLTLAGVILFIILHRRRKRQVNKPPPSQIGPMAQGMPLRPGFHERDGNRTVVSAGTAVAGGVVGSPNAYGERRWTSGGFRDYGSGVPRPPPKMRARDVKYPPSSPYGPI